MAGHVHLEGAAVDLAAHLAGAVEVDVADRDLGPLCGEAATCRGADPAGAPGDDRDLTLEPHRARDYLCFAPYGARQGISCVVEMALPPGPRAPAPVQMWQWIARPIPFLTGASARYGDFFTVRFVFGPVVFIADPQVIKDVFRGDPDVFHAGEGNATPLEPLMGRNSVLLLDGPEHMRQRKLMLPSFHGERMQRYGELME